MQRLTQHSIQLRGRRVHYHLVVSRTARKLRVRVGPNGVQVVQPASRKPSDAGSFLRQNERWVLGQLRRVESLGLIRRGKDKRPHEILFRGHLVPLGVERTEHRSPGNKVVIRDGGIVIRRGPHSKTATARSLENWLRRQARREIERHLEQVSARLKRKPNRVYVMNQRTKWGNCSPKRNLSFNWRLILAPDFVLRYLVTHEAAHLAVPDHSPRFWLTVQSLCAETEPAKRWFSANSHRLLGALPNP